VGVAADSDRHRGSHGPVVPADFDSGQVEGVEDEFDFAADEGGVDLVGVGEQRHGGGFGHGSGLRPQERFADQVGIGDGRGGGGGEPFEGGGAGLGVDAVVIDGLDPGGEEVVESGQVAHRDRVDLDEELVSHGPEDPFDFPAAFWFAGATVDEADSESGTRS
jgi:hypothetical protein